MKKQRAVKLALRTALPVLLLAALLWLAAAVALWGISRAELTRSLDAAVEALSAALSAVVPADAVEEGVGLTTPEETVLEMRAETLGLAGCWVYGAGGASAPPLFHTGEAPETLGALLERAVAGGPVRILEEDGAGGWRLLCARPLHGAGGGATGYLAAERDVGGQVSALRRNAACAALAVAALAALLAAAALCALQRSVVAPVGRLSAAAAACAHGGGRAALEGLTLPKGPLSGLAGDLKAISDGVEEQIRRAGEAAAEASREAAQMGLAGEINDSVLPHTLPEVPGRAGFEVLGRVERGHAVNAYLYDYFFIDPGLLCVVIGDVPGHGIPASLFMVVAQTTIRSRLRMGRSLAETMADVNRQLYDLGNQLCFNALVGTLSLGDGRFSYVNAGQRLPLIMRNEDRYEWLESPVYAPLGRNENVSYRLEELRLKQGDRLFFYTSGMADIRNRANVAFGAGRLRVSLNLSRSRDLSPGDLLAFAGEEARAFPEDSRLEEGFALLVLEYRKGEKELAHCDVPNRPECAGEVAAFLKRQFEENGTAKRYYARTAVLVDEMFALCCRWAIRPDTVMVECGIAPDAQMVTIRMTAVLGGVDPLSHAEEGVAGDAAEFIRGSTDFVSFKRGEERDTIVMVSYLGE